MSDKGFVSIHRKIWDSAVWDSDEPFDHRSAWIDLVLMANYEDKQFYSRHGTVITIRRGQTLTTVRRLADRWHWGKEKVSKYLESLQLLDMIYQEKTKAGTLLTLRNYCDYQAFFTNSRTQTGHKPDTDKDADKDIDPDRLNKVNKLPNKTNKGDASSFPGGNY